jgi:hypothetical protein
MDPPLPPPPEADADDADVDLAFELEDQEEVGMDNVGYRSFGTLQDLETWLANNALHGTSSGGNNDNRSWENHNYREHDRYQQEIHDRIFGGDDEGSDNEASSSSSACEASAEQQDRLDALRRFDSQDVVFLARASANDENHPAGGDSSPPQNAISSISKARVDEATVAVRAPLRPVAEACETVFVAASRNSCTQFSPFSDDATRELYPEPAVVHLLRVILNEASAEETPDDLAVDCCRLAHYLQHSSLADAYASMLSNSVNAENCYSLLLLADRLQLPILREKSLHQVLYNMDRLTMAATSNGQLDDFMTKELRGRVASIQTAIRSSLLGASPSRSSLSKDVTALRQSAPSATIASGSSSRLVFSLVEQHVLTFAERVQYVRERLTATKERRDKLSAASEADDRFFDGCLSQQYADDWQAKIERTERNLGTLEVALQGLHDYKNRLAGSSYGHEKEAAQP